MLVCAPFGRARAARGNPWRDFCRSALAQDARGAVYVEFVIAFLPLFTLFLAVCQLALIASARLVVQHAALAGARSAIVVLEEPPEDHDGAPRGSLSQGRAGAGQGPEGLLALLRVGSITDLAGAAGSSAGRGWLGELLDAAGIGSAPPRQQGARMGPIRTAAYFPLLVLAPSPRSLSGAGPGSLAESLPDSFSRRVGFALRYTRAAAVVTVHAAPGAEALAAEPVGPKAPVTVRVTYLYPCAVPLVRGLMCRSLGALLAPEGGLRVGGIRIGQRDSALAARLRHAEAAGGLDRIAGRGARFAVLTGEATLPNQGAAYYRGGGES